MKKRIIAIYVLFILSVSYSYALEYIDRNYILSTMSAITQERYPDAHYVLLDSYHDTKVDGSGKAVEFSEKYYKVFDEKGKKNFKVLSFDFNTSYETFAIKNIEIIKPDGKIISLNVSENMTIEDSPSEASSNIYDAFLKRCTVQVPQLAPGDIFYYSYNRKEIKTIIDNSFSSVFSGEEFFPIIHSKDVLIIDNKIPLKYNEVINKIDGHFKLSSLTSGNNTIYTFEVNNVAQILPEPAMPEGEKISMNWFVSTLSNWNDISKWYFNLCESKIVVNKNIKEKSAELIKNAKTDKEKIEAIFFYVSRKVRYMGATFEENKPGFEPHSTDYTFDTMTGVCRDKAALIVAMLRSAGFDANMVLMNASQKLLPNVPELQFNHAICGVKLKSGEEILMDPTDETTHELLPSYLSNKSYIVATKNGDSLKTTPVIPASVNKTIVNTKIKCENGIFTVTSSFIFLGLNDNYFRSYFASNTDSDNLYQDLASLVKSYYNSAALQSFNIEPKEILDSSKQLKLTITYSIPDAIIEGNGYKMFNIDRLGLSLGIYPMLFSDLSLSKRKYPFVLPYTASTEEYITLEYNDTNPFEISYLPGTLEINSLNNKYSKKYLSSGKNISLNKYAEINKIEYSTEEYLQFKNELKQRENFNKKYIIIKNTIKRLQD